MANTGAGNAGEAKNSEQLEVRKVERDPILAEINTTATSTALSKTYTGTSAHSGTKN